MQLDYNTKQVYMIFSISKLVKTIKDNCQYQVIYTPCHHSSLTHSSLIHHTLEKPINTWDTIKKSEE